MVGFVGNRNNITIVIVYLDVSATTILRPQYLPQWSETLIKWRTSGNRNYLPYCQFENEVKRNEYCATYFKFRYLNSIYTYFIRSLFSK